MSEQNNTVQRTFLVAVVLCLVCSFFVSGAAVFLRPKQNENRLLDKRGNIMATAGLTVPADAQEAMDLFESRIETRYVRLASGEFVSAEEVGRNYSEKEAARDPKASDLLESSQDIAGIKRLPHIMPVYFLKEGDVVSKVILPVYGYGLWSTLYGFLALSSDYNTVEGLSFYQHGETPGLGGEVDNPRWKDQWKDKLVFDEAGKVRLSVVKGEADRSGPEARFEVDGLSGATITARGVDQMVKFWMGPKGYGSLLGRLKERGIARGE